MHLSIEPSVLHLKDMINYHEGGISSRSLNKRAPLADTELTLLALAKGESISTESSPIHKVAFVVDGQLAITLPNDEIFNLNEGDCLFIPAKTLHSFMALTNCKYVQIESK